MDCCDRVRSKHVKTNLLKNFTDDFLAHCIYNGLRYPFVYCFSGFGHYRLAAAGYALRGTRCRVRVAGYALQGTRCRVRGVGYPGSGKDISVRKFQRRFSPPL